MLFYVVEARLCTVVCTIITWTEETEQRPKVRVSEHESNNEDDCKAGGEEGDRSDKMKVIMMKMKVIMMKMKVIMKRMKVIMMRMKMIMMKMMEVLLSVCKTIMPGLQR